MAETNRGRKPQDHQQSNKEAHEARLERDAYLADMPELVPPHRLRFRERARIRAIMLDAIASGAFDGTDSRVDDSELTPEDAETIKKMDDLCVMIDEFAQSIAIDESAYDEWSRGKGYNEFFAVLSLYDEALGESNGS